MSARYIHYGHEHFDRAVFGAIKNRREPWYKPDPHTGFWASRIDARFGWKEWCDAEEWYPDDFNVFFQFELAENANVVYLTCADDFDKLPMFSNRFEHFRPQFFIDFEECVRRGIDAIEILDINKVYSLEPIYGWDCDSILILNPDIVKEVA